MKKFPNGKPRLSNCPFCESKAEFWRCADTGAMDFDGDYIRCKSDQCGTRMGPVFLEDNAHRHLAMKWNRRPAIHKARRDLTRAKVFTAGRLEDNKSIRQQQRKLSK